MATFPINEPKTIQLATEVELGLPKDPIFADSPVTPADLSVLLQEFAVADSEKRDAYAIYLEKSKAKNLKYKALIAALKRILKWAERLEGITGPQLKTIGWGLKSTPKDLMAPGQCENFRFHAILGTRLEFDWTKPRTGGKISAYKLYRRPSGPGEWILVDALGSRAARDAQIEFPPGKWEVIVTALNNAGEGPPSNSVTVVVG